MTDFSIDVSELNQLAKELAHAGETKQQEARSAVQRVARQVKQRAQAEAPRDRPWLATQGIHFKTWKSPDGVHVDVFTGMDERGVNVGFLVDSGTSDIAPQPFLSSHAGWAGSEVERELSKILDPFEHGPTDESADG